MAVNSKIAESLARLTFEHREEEFRHHTYDEDLYHPDYHRQSSPDAHGTAAASRDCEAGYHR